MHAGGAPPSSLICPPSLIPSSLVSPPTPCLAAYPLDGGRIFADLLLLRGVAAEKAAKITAGLAAVLGCGVVALGVWRTLDTNVAGVLTIFVGLWMLYCEQWGGGGSLVQQGAWAEAAWAEDASGRCCFVAGQASGAAGHPQSPLRNPLPAATLLLWEAIRAGAVQQHPLFKHAEGGGAGGAAGTGPAMQLPAVGGGASRYQRYGGEGEV